jgi:hypothetical protein
MKIEKGSDDVKKTVGDNLQQSVPAQLPRRRVQNLVVDDGLPDELLVYDLDRHKAHCLNQAAALVWKSWDGKSTASEIARRISRKLKSDFPEDAVWLALRQLERLHLLEGSASIPHRFAATSRREMIRNLSIAAVVAVPIVTSIVSPTPAQAVSCAQSGEPCGSNGLACCGGAACFNNLCT